MSEWQLPRDPLLALREGDHAPFEAFVEQHSRTLVAYFKSRGASLTRAEDLVQEVLVKLFRHAARYEPRERFEAYCFRVARNVWIDDLRRSGARAELEATGPLEDDESALQHPAAAPHDPLGRLSSAEEMKRLRGLIALLPEAHRSVFDLAVLGELAYSEIASILEIPVGTVKSRMFHAVRRLREALAEEDISR